MTLSAIENLADRWIAEAEMFRRRGQPELAAMAESYAEDLRQCLQEWWYEELTDAEAAAELGVTAGAIQKRRERGTIEDVGAPGEPRVRRADLFPGDPPQLSTGEPDVAELRLAGADS